MNFAMSEHMSVKPAPVNEFVIASSTRIINRLPAHP